MSERFGDPSVKSVYKQGMKSQCPGARGPCHSPRCTQSVRSWGRLTRFRKKPREWDKSSVSRLLWATLYRVWLLYVGMQTSNTRCRRHGKLPKTVSNKSCVSRFRLRYLVSLSTSSWRSRHRWRTERSDQSNGMRSVRTEGARLVSTAISWWKHPTRWRWWRKAERTLLNTQQNMSTWHGRTGVTVQSMSSDCRLSHNDMSRNPRIKWSQLSRGCATSKRKVSDLRFVCKLFRKSKYLRMRAMYWLNRAHIPIFGEPLVLFITAASNMFRLMCDQSPGKYINSFQSWQTSEATQRSCGDRNVKIASLHSRGSSLNGNFRFFITSLWECLRLLGSVVPLWRLQPFCFCWLCFQLFAHVVHIVFNARQLALDVSGFKLSVDVSNILWDVTESNTGSMSCLLDAARSFFIFFFCRFEFPVPKSYVLLGLRRFLVGLVLVLLPTTPFTVRSRAALQLPLSVGWLIALIVLVDSRCTARHVSRFFGGTYNSVLELELLSVLELLACRFAMLKSSGNAWLATIPCWSDTLLTWELSISQKSSNRFYVEEAMAEVNVFYLIPGYSQNCCLNFSACDSCCGNFIFWWIIWQWTQLLQVCFMDTVTSPHISARNLTSRTYK